jgi:hypothetical protein
MKQNKTSDRKWVLTRTIPPPVSTQTIGGRPMAVFSTMAFSKTSFNKKEVV